MILRLMSVDLLQYSFSYCAKSAFRSPSIAAKRARRTGAARNRPGETKSLRQQWLLLRTRPSVRSVRSGRKGRSC